MKISTKGRYSLALMLDLALHYNEGCTSIKEISKRIGISDKYLEQIIIVLNRAGYVKSVRGAQGGYLLAKAPAEYTVGSIIRLMEGSLAPVKFLEDESNQCERAKTCVIVEVWEKLSEAVSSVIDNITLEDLVSRHHEKIKDI